MRSSKRAAVPVGTLISLGNKTKRANPSSGITPSIQGGVSKKPKTDFVEVDASELVSRTELAISSGNLTLAESLIVSALNQLRSASGPTSSGSSMQTSSPGFRVTSGITGSRLPATVSLGLLVLAQSHPTLFSRVAVLDQLFAILSLTPRELGPSLPPAAVATIIARVRGLHVLVANLIYLALQGQSKWPSHLIKVYLEDSLADRVWVDQDECRLFVLNIETAFPQTYGDPRGLFMVLNNPSISGSSGQSSNAVHVALGLCSSGSAISVATPKSQDEIADAVSTVTRTLPISLAKLIHGQHLVSAVSPRFESSLQAVEVIIVNTLRDALGRRGASGVVQPATSTSSAGLLGTNVGASSASAHASSGTGPTAGEATFLRSLIRTVGMAVGLAEIRGMVAMRLEPWLTNPKVQMLSIGLAALLATNCRLGGLSPHDLDLMISMLFRIRYKLFKPNMQLAFFECLCHIVKAAPTNLYCLLNLCAAAELHLIPSTDSTSQKSASNQHFTQVVLKIAEDVRVMEQETPAKDSAQATPLSQQQLNSATMAAVAAGASTASSRATGSVYTILPFLYQHFSNQWIRIIGKLLHDRLVATATSFLTSHTSSPLSDDQLILHVHNELAPLYHFLRELSRNWRVSFSETTSSTNIPVAVLSSSQSFLPCADLANALLQDRTNRGNTTAAAAASTIVSSLLDSSVEKKASECRIVAFQFYLTGIVSLISALQMLSGTRPYLFNNSASSRRSGGYNDAIKAHQTTLRQIRLSFVRWIKTILPPIINAAVQTVSDTLDPESSNNLNSAVITCFALLKPETLIRRALLLESVTSISKGASIRELTLDYPVRSIWSGEQEHIAILTRLVTDVSLPEKLCHQLLMLGLEPTWQLLNPLAAVDMVCELIWRAASLARDSGLDTLNVLKADQLIDLMYASCTYVSEHQHPPEITELAHASVYWRVSTTAVVLAAHCVQTCGVYLWSNYPTIRRLMEMVITGDYTCSTQSGSSAWDAGVLDTERLNAEMELQLIMQLESMLLNPADGSTSASFKPVLVTPSTSKLVGRLVRNNPRGPCRLPPVDQLENFRLLAEELELGRRLWRCRHPDFLLELIRSQTGTYASAHPWLMRLVESSGSDFELLPVQCLCEYLLCDTIKKLSVVQEESNPLPYNAFENADPCEFSDSQPTGSLVIPHQSQRNLQLIRRLREEIRTFANSSTCDALVHSFFTRLSDSRSVVRQAVRQCLYLLTGSSAEGETSQLRNPVCSWLQVLQCLKALPALRSDPNLEFSDTSVGPFQPCLSAILASLSIESDLLIITAYLVYLSQLTNDTQFIFWRPVITGITNFILTRPAIVSSLLHSQSVITLDSASTILTSYVAFESLADIFVRYLEYNCTAAEAIPVDENKSVFVTWSTERQCPLESACIQAQLVLLSHITADLPTERSCQLMELLDEDIDENCSSNSTSYWLRLRNTWFIPDHEKPGLYRLPQLSPLVFPMRMYTGTDGGTTCHLSFQRQDDMELPVPYLSTELRCCLIRTNQESLVSSALRFMDHVQLVEVIENLPLILLHPSTLSSLIEELQAQVSGVEEMQLEDLLRCIRRLESVLNRESTDLICDASIGDTAYPQTPPDAVQVQVFSTNLTNDRSWTQLVADLDLLDNSQQAEHLCQLMSNIASEPNSRQIWLDHLYEELVFLETDVNDSAPSMSTRNAPSVASSNETGRFFNFIASNPELVELLCPLITLSLVSNPTRTSVFTNVTRLLESLLNTGKLEIKLNNLFSRLFHLVRFIGSTIDVSSDSVSPPVLHFCDRLVRPSADFSEIASSELFIVDSVCLFGLCDLPELLLSLNRSAQCQTMQVVDMAEQFLFNSIPALEKSQAFNSGHYVLTELLNQANPDLLRHCVYHLLQDEKLHCTNSTRVLNFVQAVLILPRITFPVPRSEPRDRPDAATALTDLIHFTVSETLCLVYHVLTECTAELSFKASLSTEDSADLDRLLAKRTPLLDLAMTNWSKECLLYLELSAGFLDLTDVCKKLESFRYMPDYLFAQFNDENRHIRPSLTLIIQRLMLHLYMRWPGSFNQLSSSHAIKLVTGMTGFSDSDLNLPKPEVDRLGSLVLIGMTSNNGSIRETAQLASKALVVHHPRAFVSLLPILSALTEGILKKSWTQFSAKGGHLLFDHVVHLLELLTVSIGEAATSDLFVPRQIQRANRFLNTPFDNGFYNDNLRHLLISLLAILMRFHGPNKRLSNSATKLLQLLQYCGSWTSWTHASAKWDQAITHSGACNAADFLFPELGDFCALSDLLTSQPCVHSNRQSESSRSPILKQDPWNLNFLCTSNSDTSNHDTAVSRILDDLDEVSQRRTEILLQYKLELTRLLQHPDEAVSATALRLLLRLLNHYPRLATGIIRSYFLPLLSSTIHLNDTLNSNLLRSLPELCLLAPTFAPKLIHACAERTFYSSAADSGLLFIDAVEDSVRRLILDGLDDAGIEHASAALLSQSNLICSN